MSDEQVLSAHLAVDSDGHFEGLRADLPDRRNPFLPAAPDRQPSDAEESTQDALCARIGALGGLPRQNGAANCTSAPGCDTRSSSTSSATGAAAHADGRRLDAPIENLLPARCREQPGRRQPSQRGSARGQARRFANRRHAMGQPCSAPHVQGLSYAEAAEVLGQPIGTTKSDVHRGLRLLRDALEPEVLSEARAN